MAVSIMLNGTSTLVEVLIKLNKSEFSINFNHRYYICIFCYIILTTIYSYSNENLDFC